MNIGKRFLLGTYYHASRPLRFFTRRIMQAKSPAIVIVYHRIADDCANNWTTSKETFEREIHWLKKNCDLVSLEEAQNRLQRPIPNKPCVAVTFDDGYDENCAFAIPLLVQERVPTTYFVAVQQVLEGTPFEHDVLMGNAFTPNTPEQIRNMARDGIEIALHSRTHADFGKLTSRETIHDEIVSARDDLSNATGETARYFSFPFGQHENLSVQAFQVAKEAGFEGVCSAYGGYNYPGQDPFYLQRCGVDGPFVRMLNWVTLDPLASVRKKRYLVPLLAAIRRREVAV